MFAARGLYRRAHHCAGRRRIERNDLKLAKGFSLADQLFNMDTVAQLADGFGRAGIFDPAAFHADVMADLQSHELKGRIAFIADVLERYLPSDFSQAAAAIERALPPPLDPTLTDDDFGHFI